VSFIEKNKAWILPLLGVGVLGVLYLNLRPSPAAPLPAPGTEAAAPAIADASLPPQEMAAGAAETDIWVDLRVFAVPPPFLADENSFRDRARRSAQEALRGEPAPMALALPGAVREPAPLPESGEKPGVGSETPATPPPELDFLIHGATGARAWFEGQPYRSGQALEGKALSVGPIGNHSVELKGPKGKTILSTNPLHHSGPSPRPAVEAP
jgi:hypothetical protein